MCFSSTIFYFCKNTIRKLKTLIFELSNDNIRSSLVFEELSLRPNQYFIDVKIEKSNEQSLHVGAVRVTFMTASRHGDMQICSISQVSFLSESPTPNGLPKNLDIMVYKAIGLRVIHRFIDVI